MEIWELVRELSDNWKLRIDNLSFWTVNCFEKARGGPLGDVSESTTKLIKN